MTQIIKFLREEDDSFEASMARAIREGHFTSPELVELIARDIIHDCKSSYTKQNEGLEEVIQMLALPPRVFHTGNLDQPHLLTGPAYKPKPPINEGRLLTIGDQDEIFIPDATEWDVLGLVFGKEHEG